MLTSDEKITKLRALYDLSQGSEEFDGGVSFQEEMEALTDPEIRPLLQARGIELTSFRELR